MKDNVLIIDTNLENCKQIKDNSLDSNTEVYYVHTMSEAMQMIKGNSYTLVIMDVLNKPYDLEKCVARAQSLMRRDITAVCQMG